MSKELSRREHAALYGPTTGDAVRLADTDLFAQIERDLTHRGDEAVFGGGKVIRDGMGHNGQRTRDEGIPDTVITNAIIIDYTGIYKADVAIRDGVISAIGAAGNPDIMDDVDIVIGASLGGQRAIEWAVTYPQRVRRLVVVASGAQTTADQAAWTHTQIRAIQLDPAWRGGDYYAGPGPTAGLALARQIAHTTYRSPSELDERFGRIPQNDEDPLHGGRLAVESYLDYHGEKIVRRFDAGSYVTLCRTMLSHDVGRDRGGVAQALKAVTARTLVVAVDSDRLFFPEQVWQMASGIPGAFYREIHSDHGHDGFLIEHDQLTSLLNEFLNERIPSRASSFA